MLNTGAAPATRHLGSVLCYYYHIFSLNQIKSSSFNLQGASTLASNWPYTFICYSTKSMILYCPSSSQNICEGVVLSPGLHLCCCWCSPYRPLAVNTVMGIWQPARSEDKNKCQVFSVLWFPVVLLILSFQSQPQIHFLHKAFPNSHVSEILCSSELLRQVLSLPGPLLTLAASAVQYSRPWPRVAIEHLKSGLFQMRSAIGITYIHIPRLCINKKKYKFY